MSGIPKEQCPNCGKLLYVNLDLSCGPPSEWTVECPDCGACPVFHINWWYEYQIDGLVKDDDNAPGPHHFLSKTYRDEEGGDWTRKGTRSPAA